MHLTQLRLVLLELWYILYVFSDIIKVMFWQGTLNKMHLVIIHKKNINQGFTGLYNLLLFPKTDVTLPRTNID